MFLIRPKPYQNESILGYLVRASYVNGLKSPLQIFHVIGSPILNNRMPNDKILLGEYEKEALLDAFNLDETEFHTLFAHQSDGLNLIGNFSVPSAIFRTNHPRFCPLCVQEKGFIDGSTFFLPMTYCNKHGVELIDTLDGKRLKWSTPFLFEKLLEFRPSNGVFRKVSLNVVAFNKVIEKLMSHELSMLLPVQLKSFNLDEISQLIDFSMRYKNRMHSKTPLNITNYTNNQLANSFEDARSFLMDWPKSFDELLLYYEKNPMSHSRGKHGVRYCFRDLYDELYAKQNKHSVAYTLLKERFEHYLSNKYSASPFLNAISRVSVNLQEQSLLVTRNHAAQMLHCHVGKVDIYVREGLLKPETGNQNFFKRKTIQQLAICIKNSISLDQLATQLGISSHQTRILLKNHIIKPLTIPNTDNRDWLVEKKEVKRFFSDLQGGALTVIPDNAEIISSKNITFDGVDFLSLIKKMLAREILYSQRPIIDTSKLWTLSQFQICRITETNKPDLIPPRLAAEQISVNINAVYDWIKRGFITAVPQKKQNVTHPVTMLHINNIEEFKTKYILSKNRKKDKRYKLISGPKLDGGVVNLYIEINSQQKINI